MMSPRSFRLAQRQHPPAAPSAPSASSPRSTSHKPSTSSSSSSSLYPFHSSRSSRSSSPSPSSPYHNLASATTITIPHTRWPPKYDECTKPDVTINITSVPPDSDATMGKRKDRRETSSLSASPPRTTTSLTTRPTTPTSPVKIPTNSKRGTVAHAQKRHSSQRSRRRDADDADSISPSLAALLAVTDIPRPRQTQRRRRRADKPLTLDEIIDNNQASEKDLSWSLSRNPLDMLLSPPEMLADNDDESVSDCNLGSALSTRTMSVDSIPSLGDSFSSDPVSSLDIPRTPSPYRGRRFSPMRKSLQPILSPPDTIDEHPLAGDGDDYDSEEMDFETFQPPEPEPAKPQLLQPFKPLKFAFKSNLTASLRALRSAAKSFSAINFPSIPPDDFLTRSILTIDPNVPYTDERRPPVTEDIPSAEMRRYLNPTSNARIESPSPKVAAGTFAASIQMRTYKIQKSRSASPFSRSPYPATSLQATPEPQQPRSKAANQTPPISLPNMRQREMRENSDFIRIAVMEMAMRKLGKLDDQRPGRARWALPPMKVSTRPYEVTADGVPVRWVAVNC